MDLSLQVRITITLSNYEARKLIGSRLESNFDLIKKQMEDIAQREGISAQELETRWLAEENFAED